MPGAGKTVGFSWPNAIAWKGSLICLDIKRELWDSTSGWRERCGQEVYLFDPAAPDGRSNRWNPFTQVIRDSPDRFSQISRMGYQIFPEVTGEQKFWVDAARKTWWGIACLLAETPSQPLTMASVLRVFQHGQGEWLNKLLERSRQPGGRPYSQTVVDALADYLGHNTKDGDANRLGDSIRTEITTALQAWSNPRIVAATSETDFDLADVRRRHMSIYVGVSLADIHYMKPLLRLFFESLLTVNSSMTPQRDRSLTVPVLLLLDEFTQLGPMKALTDALQVMRGFGFRIMLVVQNRAQIMNTYGSYGASDVFDNMALEMIYGTNDHVLADQIEKRAGDYTVGIVTRNRPKWMAWLNQSKQTEAEHPHRRPLILCQEVLQMPADQFIAFSIGAPPMPLKKIIGYEEPELIECRLPPPTIPQLQVHIPLDDGAVVTPKGRLALVPSE